MTEKPYHSHRPIRFAFCSLLFSFCYSGISILAAQNQISGIFPAQASGRPQLVAPRLLAELKSKNAGIRTEAADQIGGLRSRGAPSSLIRALSDYDAGVREAACYALGQIADPNAAPHLVHALTDTDPEVRATAAFALGMLGDRRSATALSNALEDQEASVRCSALMA